MRPFYGFVVVGAVGFVVQTIGVTILMVDYELDPNVAWGLAFALAVSSTWLLNRTFVFRTGQPIRTRTPVEYARYLLVQFGGAVLSLVVFSAVLYLYPSLQETPVVAVAAGAGVALPFNFAGAKWWVFAVSHNDQVPGTMGVSVAPDRAVDRLS